MINNKISTVIPTFNREFYLKEAIFSCLNQTIEHEIIVCNHGSKDGTDVLVKAFGNKIKYLSRPNDHGPIFCWLEGVMEAKGEYINLLFDDDLIKPKFIEDCIKYFDDEEVGFVFAEAEYIDDATKKVYVQNSKAFPKSGIYNISSYESYFVQNLISPTSLIMRKKDIIDSLFQGKLPFSKFEYKGVGPDKLMILMCLLRYKKFGYVSDYLSIYRKHNNSITIDAYNNEEKKKNFKRAYREVVLYYYGLKYAKLFWFLFYIGDFFRRLKHRLFHRKVIIEKTHL
jgi:glycosyltransferase involved in cell wall biosynthesis